MPTKCEIRIRSEHYREQGEARDLSYYNTAFTILCGVLCGVPDKSVSHQGTEISSTDKPREIGPGSTKSSRVIERDNKQENLASGKHPCICPIETTALSHGL